MCLSAGRLAYASAHAEICPAKMLLMGCRLKCAHPHNDRIYPTIMCIIGVLKLLPKVVCVYASLTHTHTHSPTFIFYIHPFSHQLLAINVAGCPRVVGSRRMALGAPFKIN